MNKKILSMAMILLSLPTFSLAASVWKSAKTQNTNPVGTEVLYTEKGDGTDNEWLLLSTVKDFSDKISYTGTIYSGTSTKAAVQAVLNAVDNSIDVTATAPIQISAGGVISMEANAYQAYDANMITWPSAVSATEVGYVDGLTSNAQTQLDDKAPKIATEVDGSSSITLTAAQVSGTIVTNYGQAASDITLTLPTAAAGYNALFTVGTTQTNKWRVRAGSSDKIYLVAAAGTVVGGADNGYATITNAQIGQSFACWTFKTGAATWDWQCKAGAIGTSTFVAE